MAKKSNDKQYFQNGFSCNLPKVDQLLNCTVHDVDEWYFCHEGFNSAFGIGQPKAKSQFDQA